MLAVPISCWRWTVSHGGVHHVAAQCHIGRNELESGGLDLGTARLQGTAGAAENIGHVAQIELRGEQVVVGVHLRKARGIGERVDRVLGAQRIEAALHVRPKERGALRLVEIVRLAEGRARGVDVGISLECLLDEGGELRRLEQLPPLPRDIHPADELLGVAAGAGR